jgi:flagellar assembly protein FliH
MLSDRNSRVGTSAAEAEPYHYQAVRPGSNGSVEWLDSTEDPLAKLREAREVAFEQGQRQGEAQARTAAQVEIAAVREMVLQAVEKFKAERVKYFARTEAEVVQLALAIAKKILHREAQIDPLLLTGMVHVALEKFDAGTRVLMRTHPSDIRLWTEYFAQSHVLSTQIELIGDAALRRGECVLETESGKTQLSLDGQLKEIEQGFLDLLEQRPAAR